VCHFINLHIGNLKEIIFLRILKISFQRNNEVKSFQAIYNTPTTHPEKIEDKGSVLRYIIKLDEPVISFCVIILTDQIRERRDKFIEMEMKM